MPESNSGSSRSKEAETPLSAIDPPARTEVQSLITSAATGKYNWGPTNPHPLSQMHTELVWEGKYDEFGGRRVVDVAALAMPMQRIERVDEPRQRAEAQGQLELWEKQTASLREQTGEYTTWRNRLIWGDNKLVMASLLKEFKGRIDLIYIDPPFDVGADFTMDVPIGDGKETIGKDQSTLEMVAYRDMWGKGTDSYLHMMFERLSLMKELLSEKGSIYVHVGPNINHLIRSLLDDVFGQDRHVNEIIWRRAFAHSDANRCGIIHDAILLYAKSETWKWNVVRQAPDPDYVETFFDQVETPTGKRYQRISLTAPGVTKEGQSGKPWRGINPSEIGRHWAKTHEELDRLDRERRIHWPKQGVPRLKRYEDEYEGMVIQDIWTDLNKIHNQAVEALGYSTQKPEALLERIVRASSSEDDLVADFFCGSGTTGALAERLGRRWIMSDLGRFAIHTSRKRLIELQRTLHADGKPYRAFDVYNLGRYERQWWQKDRLKGAEEEHRRVVLEFFKAEVLASAPSPLLHGRKAGAFCHVDGIDSIFTRDEARALAQAVAHAGGREVYCLAWEFEMELRQHCLALEAELGVKMKLIPIPREIMEKNRKSPPPFLEMAVLEAEVVKRGAPTSGPARAGSETGAPKHSVDVKLTKFLPSLAEVPSKELAALKERAIRSGFDFIDFWAVDFDWQPGQPFHHDWQDYRTRKDRTLKTVSDAGHVYDQPGKHTICVKVVDVFGCDTSITLEV